MNDNDLIDKELDRHNLLLPINNIQMHATNEVKLIIVHLTLFWLIDLTRY